MFATDVAQWRWSKLDLRFRRGAQRTDMQMAFGLNLGYHNFTVCSRTFGMIPLVFIHFVGSAITLPFPSSKTEKRPFGASSPLGLVPFSGPSFDCLAKTGALASFVQQIPTRWKSSRIFALSSAVAQGMGKVPTVAEASPRILAASFITGRNWLRIA